MKKRAIGFVVVAALIGSPALAADLALKAPPLAPVANWAGFYVGGNAGWVGSIGDSINNTGTDTDGGGLGSALGVGIPTTINLDYSGFLGGGQVGYNWQNGNVVYGLEADLDAASASSNATLPDARVVFLGGLMSPFTISAARQLDWVGTLRGRLGITPSATFLLYATGGLAYGEHEVGIGINDPTARPPALLFNQTSTWSAGWTLGLGSEWMFAPHWSLKAEYLYVDLGGVSSTIDYAYTILRRGSDTSSLTATVNDHDSIVRGGINYHF